jgi:hypothetical protein
MAGDGWAWFRLQFVCASDAKQPFDRRHEYYFQIRWKNESNVPITRSLYRAVTTNIEFIFPSTKKHMMLATSAEISQSLSNYRAHVIARTGSYEKEDSNAVNVLLRITLYGLKLLKNRFPIYSQSRHLLSHNS